MSGGGVRHPARSYGYYARPVQCGLCVHGTAPCKAYTDDHLRERLPVRLYHLRRYHNITGKDKQQLLLETLRVLKKGGIFAIHDLMSPGRYGDMQAFVQKLRDMGYERVELIDTTDGSFMTPKEAKRLMLRGSTLLVGRK